VPGSRCLLTLVLPALVMPPGFDPPTRLWGGRLGLVRSLAQRTVDDLHRSVPVGASEGQDGGDVRRGVVIAEHRRSGAFPGAEITPAGAQVVACGQCRVVDALRVRCAVTVPVGGEGLPGRGDELHRSDRSVPGDIAVPPSVIGVRDRGHAFPTSQYRPVDSRARDTLVVEAVTGVVAVSGLDLADGSEQRPVQMAG